METKNGKHIQTHNSAMGPINFELWVMETELWLMETENPYSPWLIDFVSSHSLPSEVA